MRVMILQPLVVIWHSKPRTTYCEIAIGGILCPRVLSSTSRTVYRVNTAKRPTVHPDWRLGTGPLEEHTW